MPQIGVSSVADGLRLGLGTRDHIHGWCRGRPARARKASLTAQITVACAVAQQAVRHWWKDPPGPAPNLARHGRRWLLATHTTDVSTRGKETSV